MPALPACVLLRKRRERRLRPGRERRASGVHRHGEHSVETLDTGAFDDPFSPNLASIFAQAALERAAAESRRAPAAGLEERLARLEAFFSLIDAGIGAFVRGEAFPAEKLRNVIPLMTGRSRAR